MLAVALLLHSPSGRAEREGWEFGGHAKYLVTETRYQDDDLEALYGDNPAGGQQLDARLKAEKRAGAWDFAVHYEVLALNGDTLETRRALAAAGLPLPRGATGLPDDDTRLFDLTDEFVDRPRTAAVQRLDRLSIGYGTSKGLVRFGRQAVSWGNGLVFQPLDFLNPFSPVAIDKDYKTGDDMLYGQLWIAGQSDVQAIVVPRRDPVTHEVTSSESSYAAKWRQRFGRFDVDVLAARHYLDNLLGLGLVRSVGGAVWRLDVEMMDIDQADTAWSAVTNLDYSWVWLGRNMYGYAEYFRNGLGAANEAGYLTPDPALSARVQRGELFTARARLRRARRAGGAAPAGERIRQLYPEPERRQPLPAAARAPGIGVRAYSSWAGSTCRPASVARSTGAFPRPAPGPTWRRGARCTCAAPGIFSGSGCELFPRPGALYPRQFHPQDKNWSLTACRWIIVRSASAWSPAHCLSSSLSSRACLPAPAAAGCPTR
ncbi:MAG: hypothetical protein MZW92_45990 [Comamonadaceae bacterium]|nr:hypothetical protein [Comamonadaceae bacterium]